MLNIKNPETHKLAHELADLEDTTLTEAVTNALRLAIAEHTHRRTARRQVLEGLVAAARTIPAGKAGDPFADLYDEAGLPR